jgi:uncharacterized protein (TIGR02266 family)
MDDTRATRIETDIKVTSPYSALPSDAHITNLSASGAFIHTKEPLTGETTFALNFRLPGDNAAISVHARVVWSRSTHSVASPGMGVQFTTITPEHKNKLADFVQRSIWGDSKKPTPAS